MITYTNEPIDITSFTDKWGGEYFKTNQYIISVTFDRLSYVPLFASKSKKHIAFPLLALDELPFGASLVNFSYCETSQETTRGGDG